MPRARPGGTVTFLFTDIEDSTRRWDDDPSEMADALRVHDAILRAAIERHDGYVFSTGGDGFCVAFSTAADAAAVAVEAQEELRDESAVDFSVRMGLHTGEAIERDRNYFGSEVNRAAAPDVDRARRAGARVRRDRSAAAGPGGVASAG